MTIITRIIAPIELTKRIRNIESHSFPLLVFDVFCGVGDMLELCLKLSASYYKWSHSTGNKGLQGTCTKR